MADEPKIAGPWEQGDRGNWIRRGLNGIPWAEVWPRGYTGYGWTSGGDEGVENEAATSNGNLAAAKRSADGALTAVGCDLIAAWPTVGHTVRLPRPFEVRAAEFLAGLQALTERTGLVALAQDRDGDLTGSITLKERSECIAGGYEANERWLSWERVRSPEEVALLAERQRVLAEIRSAEVAESYLVNPDRYAPLHEIDRQLRRFY